MRIDFWIYSFLAVVVLVGLLINLAQEREMRRIADKSLNKRRRCRGG